MYFLMNASWLIVNYNSYLFSTISVICIYTTNLQLITSSCTGKHPFTQGKDAYNAAIYEI